MIFYPEENEAPVAGCQRCSSILVELTSTGPGVGLHVTLIKSVSHSLVKTHTSTLLSFSKAPALHKEAVTVAG